MLYCTTYFFLSKLTLIKSYPFKSVIRSCLLTVTKYLREDPFLVVGINVVGGFSRLVGSVQQTTVSRVTQKQLCDSLTSGPQ